MIPSLYPLLGLLACLVVIAAVLLAPFCSAFRKTWFLVSTVVAVIYGGTKPPKPVESWTKIAVLETSPSNVTISVSSSTNELHLSYHWQARRMTMFEDDTIWGPWEMVGPAEIILSTNFTETVSGRFVNGRRDTQIRLVFGDGRQTNEVTP